MEELWIDRFVDRMAEKKDTIIYILTLLIAVLYIVVGHGFAMENTDQVISLGKSNLTKAKVLEILDSETVDTGKEGGYGTEKTTITFTCKILNGEHKGEVVEATQRVDNYTLVNEDPVSVGNKVLINSTKSDDGLRWYFTKYARVSGIIILGVVFLLLLVFLGRKKGVNTVLALVFTCLAVFYVFLPAVLGGRNIYVLTTVTGIYVVAITLLIVYGANKKSLVACVGCIAGILFSALLTLIMSKVLHLSGGGMLDDEGMSVLLANLQNPLDLKGVIFSTVVIGAIGAIMDVSMSISTSLYEIQLYAPKITMRRMLKSGLNIGRDIMGTMANTLVLAYIGGSLCASLLYVTNTPSLDALFNREVVIIELLQTLVGSFALLATIPLTTYFAGLIYCKKKTKKIAHEEIL